MEEEVQREGGSGRSSGVGEAAGNPTEMKVPVSSSELVSVLAGSCQP